MFKYDIKFTDYDGNPQTKTLYFNLNKPEAAKFDASLEGGLSEYIRKIYINKQAKEIIETFDNLIRISYGIKSDDGLRFIKSEKITEEFCETEAYSEFFYILATNEDVAISFINGVMPNFGEETVTSSNLEEVKKELGIV